MKNIKSLPENAATFMLLEKISKNFSRISIVIEIDGTKYKNVHVSGPTSDVEDYFNNEINMEQLQKRWR